MLYEVIATVAVQRVGALASAPATQDTRDGPLRAPHLRAAAQSRRWLRCGYACAGSARRRAVKHACDPLLG